MSDEKKNEGGAAFIKIPTEQLNFLRKNKVFGEKIGKLLVYLQIAKEKSNKVRSLMLNPETYRADLVDYTEEELKNFMSIIANVDAAYFSDLPREAFEKIIEKLNDPSVTEIKD